MKKQFRTQSGQIIFLGLIVVGLVLVNTLIVIGGALLYSQNSRNTLEIAEVTNLAEAGVDKAVASLNATGGSYSGESETRLNDGSFSVVVTTSGNNKIVTATGYVPNKIQPRVKRTLKISASKGVGTSFKYGVQVGEGGLTLGSSDTITGSVYSNGNVTAVNRLNVTGDVWVAGGTQGTPNQSEDCQSPNCGDFTFGTVIQSLNIYDVAQSFKQSVSGVLNKVSLKIKKVNSPSLDLTVRILGDQNGQPNKNNVLATGTLYKTLVTSNYSWVDVAFLSSPTLQAETPYWLMIDSSSDGNNHWVWQSDPLKGYIRGSAMWSPDWKAGNPQWNAVDADLSFQTFSGGVVTYFDGGTSATVAGNVHADTIKDVAISQGAYYQAIDKNTVTAASFNPGSADPTPKTFPISDGNITEWKQQAESAGVISGPLNSCHTQLGPGKVTGDVNWGSCTVTIISPVWVTGNLTLNNNNHLTLDSSFGGTSGVIIVDGQATLKNNNVIRGTGLAGSNLMLLSTYDSRSSGTPAIIVSNTGNSSFLYADKGIIQPGNSNTFQELTAWGIDLFNNSTISYDTGLAASFFSSGPSGSYYLIKGTYQLR